MARSENALTAQNVGVPTTDVMDFGDDAGAGLEGLRREEQATPFLRMLQSNSPQLSKTEAQYIPGAEQGQILNTASEETYDGEEGVGVVVCARHPHWGMWIPRDLGTGFRGLLPPDDPAVLRLVARQDAKHGPGRGRFNMPRYRERRWTDDPFQVPETGEEVEVIETINLYVLYGPLDDFDSGTVSPAIVRFASTSIPVYQGYIERHKRWRWRDSEGNLKPGPLWLYRWRLGTRAQSNNKGKFFNWQLTLAPPAKTFREAVYRHEDPKLYEMAHEFYREFTRGTVKVDYDAASGDAVDPDAPPF
jgi:hypothetical protein